MITIKFIYKNERYLSNNKYHRSIDTKNPGVLQLDPKRGIYLNTILTSSYPTICSFPYGLVDRESL